MGNTLNVLYSEWVVFIILNNYLKVYLSAFLLQLSPFTTFHLISEINANVIGKVNIIVSLYLHQTATDLMHPNVHAH